MILINYDKLLNINTTGFREYPGKYNRVFHRTESTSYHVLKKLVNNYDFSKHTHLVDVGSGKGRVLFFLNHYVDNLKVTGIEGNPDTFRELTTNKEQYLITYGQVDRNNIQLENTLISDYAIQSDQTVFYLFNPFAIEIFKAFVYQLMDSVVADPREVELILYYPTNAYIQFLNLETPFELVQDIDFWYYTDNQEVIKIFRLTSFQ